MSSLAESKWLTRFLDETPGDTEVGGKSRQVPNACWSRVEPFNPPNPKLELWSDNLGDILNLTRGDGNILGGGKTTDGMDPYAQRYGGHQFGNWAGQLGDGRAITLGELALNEMIHELQLKGSGRTPYSRFADGKAGTTIIHPRISLQRSYALSRSSNNSCSFACHYWRGGTS